MLNRLNLLLGGFFLIVAFYFFANPIVSLSVIGVVATLALLIYFLILGKQAFQKQEGVTRWFTGGMMVWTLFSMIRMYFVVQTPQLLLSNILGYLTFLYLIKIAEGAYLYYKKEEGYQQPLAIGGAGLVLVLVLYFFPVIGQFVLFNLIGVCLLSLAAIFFYRAYKERKQKA